MFTQIRTVSIWSSDQERSLQFYVEKLGFEKREDNTWGPNYRWLTVGLPGGNTEIVLGLAEPGTVVGGDSGMVLECPDIHTMYQTLQKKGVTFLRAPKKQPWGGWEAILADPDGYSFVIIEPASED